jgi:hypothetical protein
LDKIAALELETGVDGLDEVLFSFMVLAADGVGARVTVNLGCDLVESPDDEELPCVVLRMTLCPFRECADFDVRVGGGICVALESREPVDMSLCSF